MAAETTALAGSRTRARIRESGVKRPRVDVWVQHLFLYAVAQRRGLLGAAGRLWIPGIRADGAPWPSVAGGTVGRPAQRNPTQDGPARPATHRAQHADCLLYTSPSPR